MNRLLAIGLAGLVGSTTAVVPVSADARHRSGSVIVFVSDRDTPTGASERRDDLYAYDARTGTTSRLTDSEDGELFPSVSPSGRYLAYGRFQGIEFCRFRSTTQGWACEVRRSLAFPTGGVTSKPVWSPDERSVYFSGTGPGEPDVDVFRADLAGLDAPVNLTDEPEGTPELPDFQPALSPDGRRLVLTRGGDLWQSRADGSHLVQLTATPPPANEFGADFSPDGRRLAFHSNRKAASVPLIDDFDVYLMRAEPEGPGNVPVDLTAGLAGAGGTPSRERYPSFSPDGRRLTFWWSFVPPGDANAGARLDLDGGEIFTVRVDGSDPTNVTDNNGADPAVPLVGDISPDWGRVRG